MHATLPRFRWPLQWLIVFGAVGTFFLLRSYYAFTLPEMACEDGSEMFAFYTNHPAPSYIFRTYFGYISLLPNLVGYLATRLPPPLTPYALAYFGLLVKTIAFTLFALRRFRFVIADDGQRILIVLVAALMPIGVRLLSDNTTYSIWNLLLILCLLVVAPLPARRSLQVLQLVVMILCAWSIPVSVVVIPVCIYNLMTRSRAGDRWVNGGLILAIALYEWLAVHPTEDVVRSLGQSLLLTPLYVLNRVVAETVLGYDLRMWLQMHNLTWLIYLFATALVAALALLYVAKWRHLARREHIYLAITLYLMASITWFSIYGRGMDSTSHMGPLNWRYFYVQQYLLVLILTVVVVRNWHRLPTPRLRTVVGIGLAAYLVTLVTFNLPYFRAYPAGGRAIAVFLHEVDVYAKQPAPVTPREFVLSRSCIDIHVTVPYVAPSAE